MAADTAQLVENAKCFVTCISSGMELPVINFLLAQIAHEDLDHMIAGAICVQTCIPSGMQPSIIVSLANDLAAQIPFATYGAAPTLLPNEDDQIFWTPNGPLPTTWAVESSANGVTGWTFFGSSDGLDPETQGIVAGTYYRVYGRNASDARSTDYSNVVLAT